MQASPPLTLVLNGPTQQAMTSGFEGLSVIALVKCMAVCYG